LDFAGLVSDLGGTAWTVAAFLVAIIVIVTVHEFGHYIVGRICGIHAEVFSLGFGTPLISRIDRHGTRWQIAALPLGGYVRFLGDADGASRPNDDLLHGLTEAEKRHTMHGAPLWARSATVVAGPLANFILAFVIFLGIILWKGVSVDVPLIGTIKDVPFEGQGLLVGDLITGVEGQPSPDIAAFYTLADAVSGKARVTYQVTRNGQAMVIEGPNPLPPVADSVQPQSAALDAGIQPGDVIIRAAGQDIASFNQLPKLVEAAAGHPIALTLWRAGKTIDVELSPRRRDLPTADGGFETRWLIGVSGGVLFEPVARNPGLLEAASLAWGEGWYMAKMNLKGLGYIIAGKISSCNVSSPIGMAKAVGAAAQSGLETFLGMLALVSLSIGLLNLFPIPVLDGGHLVFHVWEATTGHPPTERALKVLMSFGLTLLAALMLFALSNDLFRCT
jgi:regulator of sigma E protease